MTIEKKTQSDNLIWARIARGTLLGGILCLSFSVDATAAQTIGNMASSITSTFGAIGKLITAGSYIAGLGFAVGAILKFKQHKDNPTQVQIGQPISLVLIAAALLFLPTMLSTIGSTMFGATPPKTAGSAGVSIGGS